MSIKGIKVAGLEFLLTNIVAFLVLMITFRDKINSYDLNGLLELYKDKNYILLHVALTTLFLSLLYPLKRAIIHYNNSGVKYFNNLDYDIKMVGKENKRHNNIVRIMYYYYKQVIPQAIYRNELDLISLYKRRSYLEKLIALGNDYYTCLTATIISLATGLMCSINDSFPRLDIIFMPLCGMSLLIVVLMRFMDRGVLGNYDSFDYEYELEMLNKFIEHYRCREEDNTNEYIKIKADIISELKRKKASLFILDKNRKKIELLIEYTAKIDTDNSEMNPLCTYKVKLLSDNTIELPFKKSNEKFEDKFSLDMPATKLYEVLVFAEIIAKNSGIKN